MLTFSSDRGPVSATMTRAFCTPVPAVGALALQMPDAGFPYHTSLRALRPSSCCHVAALASRQQECGVCAIPTFFHRHVAWKVLLWPLSSDVQCDTRCVETCKFACVQESGWFGVFSAGAEFSVRLFRVRFERA